MPTVQFFFGVGSRYSYLAATQAPQLAHETGARFVWRAVHSRELIGRAGPDPFGAGARGQYRTAYRTQDAKRWADYYGVAYREPPWDDVDWKSLAFACVAVDGLGAGEAYATQMLRRRPAAAGRSRSRRSRPSGSRAARPFHGSAPLSRDCGAPSTKSGRRSRGRRIRRADLAVDHGESFWGQDRLPLLRRHLIRSASSGP